MKNCMHLKWGYGVVASLAIGLSGCYMDDQRSQQEMHMERTKMEQPNTKAQQPKAVKKTTVSASREPIQQVAPGPKRKAAPQLPVIQ
ncbi:MAG: hypothetical protein ACHP6H_01010 [Legionellales bacterium]